MLHTPNKTKRVLRKGAGGRQTQLDIPPAGPSNITSEDSSASRASFPSTPSPDHQQPHVAQSLWDKAYDALAKEMPDLVKKYDELLAKEERMANSAPNETTPSQLSAPHGLDTRSDRSPRQVQLNTVIQIGLRRMEDNKATFKIAGHEIVLEDQYAKVSNWLLWSRDWIGGAVKNSPQASLAWSGVCLILPLLTNPTTAAEANRDGFVYVTSRMGYYVALEPMVRRLGQNDRVDEALISAANDHIVDLYQAILDFQLSSVLRFYQSRLRTFVHDIVTLKNWKQNLLDIKTREKTVNNDIGQINDLAARQELEFLNKTSEETHAAMEDYLSVATQQLTVLSEQLSVSEKQLSVSNKLLSVSRKQLAARKDAKRERQLVKQQAEREKQLVIQQTQQERRLAEERKCLQAFWLTSSANSATYDWYKDRVEYRVEGTCNWFLEHENFQKWLSQESGPLLVSADPGCGKSVLAKYLIDYELAQLSATICYFFFKDQDQNTIRQALCALLHQLFFQKSALIQHAMELYNKMGAALVDSETQLWTILRDAVRDPQAGPVIFVIDALDECAESELSSFVRNLEDMFRDQQLADAKFKVLMTSRPYEHVVSEFYSLQDAFPRIHIFGEEEFEAISREVNIVIHHRVVQLAKKHRLSDEIESSLNSKLLAIDHRTYLWVYLVFDYLDKGLFEKTDDGIDAAFQTLPKTVNQAYDQILNRSQRDETVQTVKKALSIILAAHRPLTLSEMKIAMKLNGQGRGQSVYDLSLEQDVDFKTRLRTLCGLFVNIHHDKVYFLHQTAREFLIQSSAPTTISSDLQWHHSITTRHAHSVLAEICMFYLDMLNSTHTETFCEDDHQGALLGYSVEYWDDHYRVAEFGEGSAMLDLASRLCTPDLTSHSQWASIISRRYNIRPESSTGVLVALHLGFTPVTELLLSRRANTEAKDISDRTALILAAIYDDEAVTRLLLEYGADVEARDDEGTTALISAAEHGDEIVTRLLLENGADVEASNDNGWTALISAANNGDEAVIRLLLENGADVEATDDDGWTALMFAADSAHEAVTRLLLEYGADARAKNNDGTTALIFAAKYGDEAVIWLLLENGADVRASNDIGRTALMFAAGSGYEAVTRLLLKDGADVEARDDHGWTALMFAADSGHEAVTRLLLEYGADVRAKNNDGTTALTFAAGSGHEVVIRLLLENGADIKAKNNDCTTALMLAAISGHEAVIRLLLENGADVEAKDGHGWTALIFAAGSDHEAITRLLLENGADIEAKNSDAMTAMLLAAGLGHEAVTRLLLENGADVEAKYDSGATALMTVAGSGYEAVIRLLLEHGADVEASIHDGSTALFFAARPGHEAVIRLLLEYGADVRAKNSDGATALCSAARSGHEPVMRLLLENGADVEASNGDGMTALMLAADSGHEVVTRLLLDNGADVEAKNNNGTTALIFAADSGHEAVIWLLLENGADVGAKNNDGTTALIFAAEYGDEAVTRLLLENGADVEAQHNDGWTALMIAAQYGHEAVTRLLLEDGADVEATDDDGWTALMFAADSGHEAVIQLLLEYDADVEARDDTGTAVLMFAAGSGHEAVTRLLLEKGADVEASNDDGMTALMLAADSGHEAVIRLLLENHVDVRAKNNDGTTALMIAADSGHEVVTRLLLENGADVEARE